MIKKEGTFDYDFRNGRDFTCLWGLCFSLTSSFYYMNWPKKCQSKKTRNEKEMSKSVILLDRVQNHAIMKIRGVDIVKKNIGNINEQKIVDQIRMLGIDMIHEANSGHPGIVLGAAPILYTLYAHHLKFSSQDPEWINRDRFVLSAGHGSALLYATLFMAGFDLELEDLKKFRQIDSITPGHPEYKTTPGVDMSTGPLGQGFASAVGMAIAERYLANTYNKYKDGLIDHYTYVLCGDGDLMEGISYEAASLAGTLKLHKLIVLYDSNNISLDGSTDMTFTENVTARFDALGWSVITVPNGEDPIAIDKAIQKAKQNLEKPTLIQVKTTIGKYSKLQGTNQVHGSPLTDDDISAIKKKLEIRDIPFTVSNDAMDDFQKIIEDRMESEYQDWQNKVAGLDKKVFEQLQQLQEENPTWKWKDITYTPPKEGRESTRVTSGKILNAISKKYPHLLGGSADVASSTKTYLEKGGDFNRDNYAGRNIWFGVREHAMGAILNGLALSGLRPFGSTFLSFSDYLKPAIRMSALMNLNVLYLFTHDSIRIGEDGPTHQPVEQLIGLRSIPNLEVFRPADANEVIGVYKTVLESGNGPTAIVLGRNEVSIQETTSVNDVAKGAYIVREYSRNLSGIIIATGEDLALALEVSERLFQKGFDVRVISMPSISRFKAMPRAYQEELLPLGVKTIIIEAASSYSWNEFVYNDRYLITVDHFGYSGKKEDVLAKFNFDVESVEEKIEKLLK